ncbi:MAG: anthranilate synthase component I family protein [Flavobacteriales bacterium]|nr:anthranilate synthase component I family protein [Flavobacteriales bacterium]
MQPTARIPWSGALHWQALEPYPSFLARRTGASGGWVIGVGAEEVLEAPRPGTWCFGHLAYDMKNSLEPLSSRHPDEDGFPLSRWSVPFWVVELEGEQATLHSAAEHQAEGLTFLQALVGSLTVPLPVAPLTGWQVRTTRERYLQQVERVLHHVQRGDIYELNHCAGRTTHQLGWDPFAGFAHLMTANPAPLAAFYRMGDQFALCASPERYLLVEEGKVLAQPMKGTRRRHADPIEDARLALELAADPKERSENIMAVDVMRNDLSRVAASRSVVVEELCAVHAYPHVHQMTSTIRARLRVGATAWDAVLASFPMASMTGAPKLRSMQLIDEVEDMRRGLFSGTLGFFTPAGNADLNVVIRTLTYNAISGRAALLTGSAITASSLPELEWEECELKARSVLNALGDVG